MSDTNLVKFKNAGLPAAGIAQYKQAIQAARDQVSVGSGMQFLRLGKDDGVWMYGQEDTEIEPGSLWAINPTSLEIGVIAWPPNNSKLKEPIKKMRRIFDVNAPAIDKVALPAPANGGTWDDCVSFEMQCIGGADEKGKPFDPEDLGLTISYQQNSYGGKQAFDEIAKELMLQLDRDPRLIVPVIELKSDSYTHPKWGKVFKPVFDIVKWVAMDGTTTAASEPEDGEGQPPVGDAPKEEPQPARRGRRPAAGAATAATDTSTQVANGGAAAQQPEAQQPGVVRRRRRA